MGISETFKLGEPVGAEVRPVAYDRVWVEEQTTGPARMRIAATQDGVSLLLALAKCWSGPLGMLYVLMVPRRGMRQPGRYQSPTPLSMGQVQGFLTRFREFIERDGRHHVWVASLDGRGTLVLDKHGWIWAYGDLDGYRAILRDAGYIEGELILPVPHVHHYHERYDLDEEAVFQYWEWKQFPLAPDDDL